MTPAPDFAQFRTLLDELANAVQVVVLIAEHFENVSSAISQDSRAMSRNLKRATDALHTMRVEGSAR